MSRRKYKVRYSANVGPMPDSPPPVPPTMPPPSPPDAPAMAHGGTPQPDDDAKAALSRRIAELNAAEEMQRAAAQVTAVQAQSSTDPVDQLALPEPLKVWLRVNPQILGDRRLISHFDTVLHDAHHAGMQIGGPAHLELLDRHFAALAHPQPTHHAHEAVHHEPNGESPMPYSPPPATRVPYGAPVSRGLPGGSAAISNRVTLTPQERELAKLSGVSETEYAAQKVRLARARADGSYSEEGRR